MPPDAPEEQRTPGKEAADRKMPARAAAPAPAEEESSLGPDFGADLDKDTGCDERVEWMKARMSSALVSSGDKKMFHFFKDTDAMFPCFEFLDYEATRILFVYAGADGMYTTASVAPKNMQGKGLYFLKVSPGRVRMETIEDHVLVNDLGGTEPLQQMLQVAQAIYFPLISNQKNQESWPELISKEVTDNMHRFLANTHIILGRNAGTTILPLPLYDAPNSKADSAKDHVHLLENAVVTWTRQIKNILKLEPEQMLKGKLHPGPGMEVEFWQNKADNLNSIHEQLNGDKVRKIMDVLEACKSTYYPAFDRLCKEVSYSREEANDTLLYLKPANRFFRLLLTEDFLAVNCHFRPIMHITLLVWTTSRFYNTPSRLVVLIRELCNDVIKQACNFMEQDETMWHVEPSAAVTKLRRIIAQVLDFKEAYFLYRHKSNKVCPEIPWNFQSSALFGRLDSFLERCHDVLDLVQTLTQFTTLEHIEIGGTKGKTLTSSVHQIFFDFQQCVLVFQEQESEIMNIDSKRFEEYFHTFRMDVNELERRLGSVIIQAFDDSSTILGSFKLLDSFETLLEREILHAELERKQADLLKAYLQDMSQVQEIFSSGKDDPPVTGNAPPFAGAVAWARGLLERVQEPMLRLKHMSKIVLEAEEGREVEKVYGIVCKSLQEYERIQIEKWAKNISNTSEAKLKLPLLRRQDGALPLLFVNFDPRLVCLLREVKYFLGLNVDVPEAATAVYRNEEVFRVQTGNLDLIVNLYNQILQTLNDVEKPLVQQRMENIDKVMQRGLVHMNWKSHTITDFISQCTTMVKEVHGIVQVIKNNVVETRRILESWSENLLLERKLTRTYMPDEFMALQKGLMEQRYAEIISGSEQIHSCLGLSQKTLRATRGSNQFKAYIDHVNQILIAGLANAVQANCKHLLLQIDHEYLTKHDVNPLLEVQLRLQAGFVVFSPELGRTSKGDGIADLVFQWITSFCNIGMLVRRMDTPIPEGNYLADIQESRKVKYTISVITGFINETTAACEEFRHSFEEYSHLWLDDVAQEFKDFLRFETQSGEMMPPVIAFEQNIYHFRTLRDEIRELPGTKVMGWLKIDVRPLRNSLLNYVSKWSDAFQQYPLNHVIRTVHELEDFCAGANQGISIDVIDYASLVTVLTNLLAIKKREKETDSCFEPLKLLLHMLSKHEVQIPLELSKEVSAVQESWVLLKQKAIMMKDRHAAITAKDALLLKERGKAFESKLAAFREFFLHNMPFQYSENVDKAYATIDNLHHGQSDEHASVIGLIGEMLDINRLQECFEIDILNYDDVQICRQESVLLKCVWDAIALVIETYTKWRHIRWVDVNVKNLQVQNEWLLHHVDTLNPAVCKWNCYEELRRSMTDTHKTLPLLGALYHPSMRPRHWKQLMRATGISFETDERFCLGDLLALKLHLYEEQVLEIVDRANKEELIERQLAEVDKVWSHLNLYFELYFDDPMTNVIRVNPSLLDNLKEHITVLRQMQISKYVQTSQAQFLEKVSSWQVKLGMVDSTLVVWMDVQTKWCALRSIFIDSSDIKEKLPQETKTFMEINVDWRSLMKESASDPNVIRACNTAGRLPRLEGMLVGLEQCESALAEYLEAKRRIFPRFYFLSDADLLDILSKGKYPRMITKHLKACLSGVVALQFQDGDDGEGKETLGVFSPEGEFLQFTTPCTLSGDVEGWLLVLTEHIQKTIESTISSAVAEFGKFEKKDFLFAYCAQVVCIVLRLHFCQQVLDVLDHLEHGNDTALAECFQKLITSLQTMAGIAATDLETGDRIKLATIITLEIQHRDLIEKFIVDRIESRDAFAWTSQLRHSLKDEVGKVQVSICDYERYYGNEYIGNCGGLVSTTLTERANITLTQAIRLYLGGAVLGPAGSGKSETTKDLARNFGLVYYVFNCSDQITSSNIGHIFLGLAQLGAWACLDEFNKIEMTVLSVASSQFKTVLDAQKSKKDKLVLQASIVKIDPGCPSTVFITMYQDYERAVDLPESLRSLFRPCAMVEPDFDHIAEVLLVSQGFARGKSMAKKCVLLFNMSENVLTSQHHYDWKLRGLKTAILVAGSNLRSQLDPDEEQVLYMVLRDFSLARLASDDVLVFLNLLTGIFPNVDVNASLQHQTDFKEMMAKSCTEQELQPSEGFLLKTLQLRQVLSVRWAAYVLGPASCGKSAMLRTLCKVQNLAGERTTIACLNPKAISRNELFGHLQAESGKWKDGILTHAFRNFADHRGTADCQILILDGDIDPEWIESMNTVLDENKTLTLASGERIALTPSMRLVFESASMHFASPGTVSRGGVVCMDESSVGWTSYVRSWVDALNYESEKVILRKCFDKYMPPSLDFLQENSSTIVPLRHINLATSLCRILTALRGNGEELQHVLKSKGEDDYKLALESLFIYALVWGLGGSLADDKRTKHTAAFDRFWRDKFPSDSGFPDQGTVFDYFFDIQHSGRFVHWQDKVFPHTHVPNLPFRNIYVSSADIAKVSHVFGLLVNQKFPVMLVGLAGTGKTAMVKERLRTIQAAEQESTTSSIEIILNYFTNSMRLQSAMESGLEKKTGQSLGPRGCKHLIYFIDDLNLPLVDKYGTQQSLAFLLQNLTYKFWYDRQKLIVNEIRDIQFVSCMNPAVGSYTVDPRLQARFTVLAVQIPSEETIFHIYSAIVSGHFSSFDHRVQKAVQSLISATANMYKAVSETFTATPAKVQYVFNMRDISAVVKGLCRALRQYYSSPPAVIRLWVHECERVFCDRLVSHTDIEVFQKMLADVTMKWCDEYGEMDRVLAKPLVYTTFCSVTSDGKDPPYCGISDFEKLTHIVEEKLTEYNQDHASMKLVMFDQAVLHVCRIARIISDPSGNALLVGIGGSGKQSLARLSAFLCGYEILQNAVTPAFDKQAFVDCFKATQIRAGKGHVRILQIITDQQIVDEGMLILINDFLSSGNVIGLYTAQEKSDICNALKPQVQAEGIIDTPDNCWEFYLEAIRKNFHFCICFSPTHDKFHDRCRQFPALITSTSFNFFHPWQHDALVAVADRLLADLEVETQEVKESIAMHMAFVHTTTSSISEDYYNEEIRHAYTTPKMFLDYVELVNHLLQKIKMDTNAKRDRLQAGLEKLEKTSEGVADLREKLESDMLLVKEKTDAAEIIMKDVSERTKIADSERVAASADEEACAAIQRECNRLQRECEDDFKACEPILEEAEQSLLTLDKKNLTELKSLPSPPAGVEDVLIGVMVLTSKGSIPKDLSWNSAKKVMGNVDQFIKMLVTLDKESITDAAVAHCEKMLLTKDTFNPDRIRAKSTSASGMCSWVINICRFYRVFQVMLPKKRQLEEATLKLNAANDALAGVRERSKELDEELSKLTIEYQVATTEKTNAEKIANKTQLRLTFSDRLTGSLSGERDRWVDELQVLSENESCLLGNVLMASAFVSYIGVFNMKYRQKLLKAHWMPDVQERRIRLLDTFHPLRLLANDATIARWTNEGLPTDSLSQENAAIIATSRRWPLIIDPQLQAIEWLKSHCRKISTAPRMFLAPSTSQMEASNADTDSMEPASSSKEPQIKDVAILRTNQETCLEEIKQALSTGEIVILENLNEKIDPVIESVLSRSLMMSPNGKQTLIRLGDTFVDYNSNFALYLQTKLPNPHYKPEIVAQTTVVNFTITADGLKEQLLSIVLGRERTDLHEQRAKLLESQNSMRVGLEEMEDSLLRTLTDSEGDILSDEDLISGLEETRKTAKNILEEQESLLATQTEISAALHLYSPVADRGVLVYFLIDSLWRLDNLYHFSLSQCIHYFSRGLELLPDEDVDEEEEKRFQYNQQRRRITELGIGQGDSKDTDADKAALELQLRVDSLRDSACLSMFVGTSRGLHQHHKITFAAELCFQILVQSGSLNPLLLSFLVRPAAGIPDLESPFKEWLTASQWQSIVDLSNFEMHGGEDEEGNAIIDMPFCDLQRDMSESSRRFRDWHDLERPEEAPLPGDWRRIPEVNKLLLIRALRPDRLIPAMSAFVRNEMGSKYLIARRLRLSKVMEDSNSRVPVLFVLTPGIDPVKDVEALGELHEIFVETKKLAFVCLGQGQEPVAESTLNEMTAVGGWVFLQNLHLLRSWTNNYLEDRLQDLSHAHESFRLFLSTESFFTPIAILKSSIKLINEAPDGVQANILKAMQPFGDDFFDGFESGSAGDLKAIIFGVCVFHAVLVQRKKYGIIGWNQMYPFSMSDLNACSYVARYHNEVGDRVPWQDLRFLFGEVIYGGHITDTFDRNLLNTYLETFACDELLSGFEILPGLHTPANWDDRVEDIINHVQRSNIREIPPTLGLHSNVEVAIMMDQGKALCRCLDKLHAGTLEGISGASVQERAGGTINEVLERMPSNLIVPDSALTKSDHFSPYVRLLQQEVTLLNHLLKTMRTSMFELRRGLLGELQISSEMDQVMNALADDSVPRAWQAVSYPSLRSLGAWVADLGDRARFLRAWCAEPNQSLPKVTWLPGLFAPKSFLTAVQQFTALRNGWALDQTVVQAEVTKKMPEEIGALARDGAYIFGLFLEGASWDSRTSSLENTQGKELVCEMPVVLIKAVSDSASQEQRQNQYLCPLYRTRQRSATYVWLVGLRSNVPPSRWVISGVALVMEP